MRMGVALCLLFVVCFASLAMAQTMEPAEDPALEAKFILERLTGVKWPADSPALIQMTNLVASGDHAAAAAVATNQPQFINVVIREMAAKMSTREESVREPLNDFTATFMGAARDGLDARTLLFGNFYYRGSPVVTAPLSIPEDVIRNNNHYEQLARANLDVGASLVRVDDQRIASSETTDIPSPDPAGILTSRAFLSSHAIAGTNRRLVEYTFRQFLCLPMERWADTASFDTRVGRDVDRAPGGDQNRYLTTCKGCHTGMDGFRGAFAKWDFVDANNGNLVAIHSSNGGQGRFRPNADGNGIMAKLNRNDFIQYAGGWITTDDSFINNTNRPASVNATLFGWREPASDSDPALMARTTGVHAFGRLIAGSRRFSSCLAKRAWDSVCKHELSDSETDLIMVSLGISFESSAFSLKRLFELVATHPKCRMKESV